MKNKNNHFISYKTPTNISDTDLKVTNASQQSNSHQPNKSKRQTDSTHSQKSNLATLDTDSEETILETGESDTDSEDPIAQKTNRSYQTKPIGLDLQRIKIEFEEVLSLQKLAQTTYLAFSLLPFSYFIKIFSFFDAISDDAKNVNRIPLVSGDGFYEKKKENNMDLQTTTLQNPLGESHLDKLKKGKPKERGNSI